MESRVGVTVQVLGNADYSCEDDTGNYIRGDVCDTTVMGCPPEAGFLGAKWYAAEIK